MRPKGSHEPHPTFSYLKENYISMKETRNEKIKKLYPSSGVDVVYSLKCYDYTSSPKERQKEVARYKKDENNNLVLEVTDNELYEQAIINNEESRANFMQEADFVGSQLLTQEFINDYCEKYLNPEDKATIGTIKKKLEVYIDNDAPKTVAEVLNDNAGV